MITKSKIGTSYELVCEDCGMNLNGQKCAICNCLISDDSSECIGIDIWHLNWETHFCSKECVDKYIEEERKRIENLIGQKRDGHCVHPDPALGEVCCKCGGGDGDEEIHNPCIHPDKECVYKKGNELFLNELTGDEK